jgi:uncharacterized Zn finger protein (UPF0148 family)
MSDKVAENLLTDITAKEVSMVDRAANMHRFLVRKRQDGDPIVINPLLASDKELVAMDKVDTVEKFEHCTVCGGFLPRADFATGVCPKCQAKVEEGKVKDTKKNEEQVVPAVEVAPAVETTPAAPTVEAVKSAPIAPAVTTPVAPSVVEAVKAAPVTHVPVAPTAVEAAPVAPVVEAVKATSSVCGNCATPVPVVVVAPEPQQEKIQPALRGFLLAGVDAILARAQDAKKLLDSSAADSSGASWVPYDVRIQLQMIDTLADRLLDDYLGGIEFEVSALLAGAAVDGANDVSKAGAAMAASRLQKFTTAHGDMGSALKAAGKCHKALGDMFSELRPGVEKSADPVSVAVTAPAPAATASSATIATAPAATAPAAPAVAAPAATASSATIAKSATEISIEKRMLDLQRLVAQQGVLLEKMRMPGDSNAIPVGENSSVGATIKGDVTWPVDLADSGKKKPGRY